MFGIGKGELSIILIVLLAIVAGIISLFRALFKALSKSHGSGQNQSGRLKELQKMKDEGLISEDEFSKKRNEILSSI